MPPEDSLASLRAMVAGIPDDWPAEARADRLLERVSVRVDCLELRAALTELGARSLVERAT